MIEWLQGVWPFMAHVGLGTSLIGGLLAGAYFSPVFKTDFVWAAAVVAVLMFAYGVGVHDESHMRDLREQKIIRTVHDAVKHALESGTKDPYDDPRN